MTTHKNEIINNELHTATLISKTIKLYNRNISLNVINIGVRLFIDGWKINNEK